MPVGNVHSKISCQGLCPRTTQVMWGNEHRPISLKILILTLGSNSQQPHPHRLPRGNPLMWESLGIKSLVPGFLGRRCIKSNQTKLINPDLKNRAVQSRAAPGDSQEGRKENRRGRSMGQVYIASRRGPRHLQGRSRQRSHPWWALWNTGSQTRDSRQDHQSFCRQCLWEG